MAKKALIAMSGGVDSSVAAYLMKEAGYDCIGVTMKLYDNEDIGMAREKTCCSLSDIEDARSVCVKLGIPYYVFNFKDDFKEKVIDNFISCYQNGMTPNPCIECNRHLKFEHLYKRAKALHCDVIVTGHYAKVTHDEQGYHLLKGVDDSKDQSYVLYSLTQEQLANTCFPLGDYSKTEIRKIAEGIIALGIKECNNYDTVKVTAKVARKDKDGKRVKEVVDGKKVTVYETVQKEIKKDAPSRLHARRQMLKVFYPVKEVPTAAAGRKKNTKDVDMVDKMFTEIAPKYVDRNGGYTRIIKIGPRKGDAAMEVVLELV